MAGGEVAIVGRYALFDGDGNLVVAGEYKGSIDFGGGPLARPALSRADTRPEPGDAAAVAAAASEVNATYRVAPPYRVAL